MPVVSPYRVVGLGVSALLAGVAIVCWLDGSSSEPFIGYLDAEACTVSSACDGRVRQIFVEPGMVREADEPLLSVIDENLADEVANSREKVASLTADLQQVRARAEVELAWRSKSLSEEEFQAQLQVASCLKRKFFSDFEDVAWNDFAKRGGVQVSQKQPDDVFRFASFPNPKPSNLDRMEAILRQEAAQNEAEVSQAQLELCESRLKTLQDLKTSLPENVRIAQGVDLAEAELEKAKNQLKELEARDSLCTITAPAHGTVAMFQTRAGDRVSANEPLLRLLDEDRRFVTVQIPTRLLPRLRTDRQLRIVFPGDETRRGCIGALPPQTEPNRKDTPAVSSGDSRVSLRVEPAGKLWPEVPIGTAVRVEFLTQAH